MAVKEGELVYTKSAIELYKDFESSPQGITTGAALERIARIGRNVLRERSRESPFFTFLQQFRGVPAFLLALAAIVSWFLGEYLEAGAIGGILFINAVIGFLQERRAGDAIAALKKLTALKVKVLRDGAKQLIDADQIVPGDIIFLEAGDKVPADGRIMESHNGAALESALTGESQPVHKTSEALSSKKALGDQKNMVFSGSVITSGRLTVLVTATGMETELGHVATMLDSVDETDSPLKQKVDGMAHTLSVLVLGMALIVFLVDWLTHRGSESAIISALFTSVALAVAALPEGLPIILTLTSAIGIKRMVKRNVLIRRLMSVETLGSVTVICTDKTGTLTKNQMTVQRLYLNGAVYEVTGDGYALTGIVDAPRSAELEELLLCGALCNNGSVFKDKVTGDPTEIALIVSAGKIGKTKDQLDREHERISEEEFTSERKLMSTVHRFAGGSGKRLFAKGAADVLLERCSHIAEHGTVRPITAEDREKALSAVKTFSERALRVLGFAYKDVHDSYAEEGLVFVGLQAMMDPPREEVRIAIERCKRAGIKVVMITGDHPDTAAAVAQQLGLEVRIITGHDLDALENLDSVVEDVIIYARVNPEHKLAIVTALQRHGHVVAMTGDGVNDAPALKKADIGVAMGITGTDVAKEASQMIITDDNFSSIVNAVEEGRSIYNNIRRFIRYQLSTNVGAILVILTSIALQLPLPLLPLQILWINLSIDGPPALSLGLEPSNVAVLERKPRPRTEPLLTKQWLFHIFLGGLIMAIGTFGVFWHYHMISPTDAQYMKATTMAFTTFAFFQFFNVLNCRSLHLSLFRIGVFTNIWAWVTIFVTAAIHFAILNLPILQEMFHVVPLSLKEWGICIAIASSILIFYELKKLVWMLFGKTEA